MDGVDDYISFQNDSVFNFRKGGVNEEKPAGNYKVDFNGSNLSSGVAEGFSEPKN